MLQDYYTVYAFLVYAVTLQAPAISLFEVDNNIQCTCTFSVRTEREKGVHTVYETPQSVPNSIKLKNRN